MDAKEKVIAELAEKFFCHELPDIPVHVDPFWIEVWDAAIEAAAQVAENDKPAFDDWSDEFLDGCRCTRESIADELRKLKGGVGMTQSKARTRHDCEKVLESQYPRHMQAQDGERWTCTCGLTYEHVCDEAEGCRWTLFPLGTAAREGA